MKRSFRSTLGNCRTNPKITTYVGKYLCMQDPINVTQDVCDLCLKEKYVISRADQEYLLNKRTNIISKCRHRNKYFIKNSK